MKDAERLRPVALKTGELLGKPTMELALEDGRSILVSLDVAHARAVAERLLDVIDGRNANRAPSRRVLELELVDGLCEAE